MGRFGDILFKRFPKFIAGNLVGTVVDTLVLWIFSHFVFSRYVGKVVISPLISFELANFVNFLFSFFVTWKDRISHRNGRSFFRHYLGYNLSCSGSFLLKMAFLMLIQHLSKWDVVICNLLALCISGLFTLTMNEFVIFKRKK